MDMGVIQWLQLLALNGFEEVLLYRCLQEVFANFILKRCRMSDIGVLPCLNPGTRACR